MSREFEIIALPGREPVDKPTPVAVRRRAVRATYDAAQTTDENRRHWSAADDLSANTANSPAVRKVLRRRSRYEFYNNSYCKGMLLTLANDTIGTGPRVQVVSDTADKAALQAIEAEFNLWANEIDLAAKLRTARIAMARDGEAFLMFTTNPLLRSRVKLDIRTIDAEQISSSYNGIQGYSQQTDGIVFDDWGNPLAYHYLRQHPGESTAEKFYPDPETIPASQIIHLFRNERPGQTRGVPEITPALPLFANLRRYTLATVLAAESAANAAGVISTNSPPEETDDVEPLDAVDLERNSWLTMPRGWTISQLKAEQPTTTYGEFKTHLLNEIARCLNMPLNVATANSSGYNYSSGQLDHQVYNKSIEIDRFQIDTACNIRIWRAWLAEALLLPAYLPPLNDPAPRVQFQWDGREHADPVKAAEAQAKRLENNTSTLAHEFAQQGRDWEVELRQRAKEMALMRELGLTPAAVQPGAGRPETNDEEQTP